MKQFIYPYLLFEDAQKAAAYYKEIFDAEITYVMMGRDVPDCPEDELDKVYHLQLKFQENEIYMSDYLEKNKMMQGNQLYLLMDYTDLDAMKKAYNLMKNEGQVIQELGETFWGAIFGIIKDKFGFTWEFHYTIPQI